MNSNLQKENGTPSARKPFFIKSAVDVVALVICILLATFIWCVASFSTSKKIIDKTFYNVPIEVVNDSANIVCSVSDENLDVVLNGQESTLNKLSNESFKIYVKIEESDTPGLGKEYNVIDGSRLPNGVTVVSKTITSVKIDLDSSISKELVPTCDFSGLSVFEPYFIDKYKIVFEPEVIKLIGQKRIIDSIVSASVVIEGGKNVESSFVDFGNVILKDADGKIIDASTITVSSPTLNVTVPVFKTVDIPVNVVFKNGYFNDSNCTVVKSVESVNVTGKAEDVSKLEFNVIIDEETLSDGKNEIKYEIVLPEGITNNDGVSEVNISVTTDGIMTRKISVPGTAFEIEYPEKYTCLNIPSLTVEVRGDAKKVAELSENDIHVKISVSGQKPTSVGIVSPEITVDTDGVYIVGKDKYKVNLKLTPEE